MINRHCGFHTGSQHDCDPPIEEIDFNKSNAFYCSYTCTSNGCNRHLVEVMTSNRLIIKYITSNAIQLLRTNYSIVFIFVYYLIIRCNLFY